MEKTILDGNVLHLGKAVEVLVEGAWKAIFIEGFCDEIAKNKTSIYEHIFNELEEPCMMTSYGEEILEIDDDFGYYDRMGERIGADNAELIKSLVENVWSGKCSIAVAMLQNKQQVRVRDITDGEVPLDEKLVAIIKRLSSGDKENDAKTCDDGHDTATHLEKKTRFKVAAFQNLLDANMKSVEALMHETAYEAIFDGIADYKSVPDADDDSDEITFKVTILVTKSPKCNWEEVAQYALDTLVGLFHIGEVTRREMHNNELYATILVK